MDKYDKRGVSADKAEVHEAIKNLDKGLFKNTFCKVLPDILGGNNDFVNIMHADTAGTKTSLAYLYWRETGDISVWKGIAHDAIVMNIDDIGCSGITGNIVISSTIGRNKSLIPGEIIKTLIEENHSFCQFMNEQGINMYLAGGETADVGDIVRTIDVGITATARAPKSKIKEINIQDGDIIVGLASSGKAKYDTKFNSGIGSNGLTFARHETLSKEYAGKYPECFDPLLAPEYVFSGHKLITEPSGVQGMTVGDLLLSPTRTYLPVLKKIYDNYSGQINGIIHCTGGGQTKVLHFTDKMHIIKDNLFSTPAVFKLIQEQNNSDWKEMYKVFNMGHRLEVYCRPSIAREIISISESFGIEAKIIGRCESNNTKKLTLHTSYGIFEY